jgi:cytochrome c biogenesis protein CcmG/thiol:disulfide interchange protein DsbE
MKKLAPAVFLLGSAALVYFILGRAPSRAPGDAKAAPALAGATLDGKAVALSDYKGKVVLVDFWATWCGPCKAEIPELVKLQAALAGKPFAVLGVSMDEDKAAVGPFTASRNVNYPVIILGTENAPAGWTVPGLPTAYLVGRDGSVLKRYFGSKDPDQLRADVDAALAL